MSTCSTWNAPCSGCGMQARETVNEEDVKKAIQLVILPRATIQNPPDQDQENQEPPPPPPPPPPSDEQQEEEDQEEEDQEDEDQEDEPEQEVCCANGLGVGQDTLRRTR